VLIEIIAVSLFTAVIAIPCIASEPLNTVITAEPTKEVEIEELQQRVYGRGYNYTVAENWITRLSPEDRVALCGYKHLKAPEKAVAENVRFISDVQKVKAKVGNEKLESLPISYDAMALEYVTPVKNQGGCGSCWIFGATADFESDVIFGATADFESDVAIDESTLLDFSEQGVGDCNIWSRVGGYDFCEGGNALMTTNYFTKYGSANETCHPYNATPETCQNCPVLKNVDNWRIITGSDGESQITTIKNAILNYGPVYSTIYASDPEFSAYDSGVYEYWGPGETNHAIEIIGWDDSLTHSHGTGAWLIKNSWGTSWGASGPYPGCAWVAYGAANLGDATSAISSYKNAGDVIFYHDECGWMGYCLGCVGKTTAYGAVRFTPSQDLTLTAVDFWAVDANMQYEIKIFNTLNTFPGYYIFSDPLGTTQAGTTSEIGYYSISLNTPVQLTKGDDFIIQVKLTATTYPIPIDYCIDPDLHWSSIATSSGESYVSCYGTQFEKYDVGGKDIGIRARAQEAQEPTISISTDKTSYTTDDTMHVGLDVTNPGAARDVRFAVWLKMPDGGRVLRYTPTPVPLSAGFEYSNSNFREFSLPDIPTGTYTWHAALIEPLGPIELISHDTASWEFGPAVAGAPTEDIAGLR
jgi:C1A family cysteine protease